MSVGIITGSSSGFGKEFAGKIKKYYPNIDELWLISRSKDKLENIKKGIEPMEAIEKASGKYGRFDEAVKKIDPRKE